MGSVKKTGVKKFTTIETQPFRGGAYTAKELALVPSGGFSMVRDLRARHPGFEERPGCVKAHSTADGTNKAQTLYQFSKGKRTERHFFAQMSDGDILEAANAPPTVTTGVFGAEIKSNSGGQIPASWGNIDDILIHSNGVDQHQAYAGTDNYVIAFVKFDSDAAPPNVPEDGFDYTVDVTDGLTTTSADLGELNTYANDECVFICCPVQANRLTWTFGTANDTAAVGTLSYRKSDNSWADTTETDGTISSAKTLGQNGSMTWTTPADEIPCMMFGISGFWYMWQTATQLNATCTVTGLTYGSGFNDIVNVWDGVPVPAIEARFYDDSAGVYKLFSYDTIEIDEMTTSDKVYFNSYDNINGFYVDVGEKPNTTGSMTIDAVYVWTGAAFTTVGTVTDGTNGMANSGWVTFDLKSTAQATQFQTSRYYSYWFYFEVSDTLSDDVIISIETMPYFDIAELGISKCNEVWKDRAALSFDRWPSYLYLSAKNNLNYLNGEDFGILQAGDGRSNEIVCERRFHNELMVWQKEKGREGGCLTLFEGYSPATFGKLVISSKVGSFNAKSAVVVDGVLTSTATEEKIKTLAFFISHYGVCVSDGRTVSVISDDIQNYFDPTQSECIRAGYENEMWVDHDSAFNILKFAFVSSYPLVTSTATSTTGDKLVDTAGAFTTRKTPGKQICGTVKVGDTVSNTTDGTTALITAVDSATILSLDTDIMASGESYEILSSVPNVFPVFDLVDKVWGFDDPEYELSCHTEIEAGSGAIPILQMGGGTDDGFVYRLNTTSLDVSTAISPYCTLELDAKGLEMWLRRLLIRLKSQTSGNCTITPYRNGVAGSDTLTLNMAAEQTSEVFRRWLVGVNVQNSHISLKIEKATGATGFYLLDLGLEIYIKDGH